jgi:type IV secretory pathway TraG/TraD family ATPase VirD4
MVIAMTQGWSGALLTYAAVQIPMAAGLVRSGGAWYRLLPSPIVAAPLSVLVGAGMSLAEPALSFIGATPHGLIHTAVAASLAMSLGYRSGEKLAKPEAQPPKEHQRGTVIAERPADVDTRSATRVRRQGRSPSITLAGQAIAASDETKHFKIIGTTGTGKSTAIREILEGALARGDRAVIADPDGGYLDRFYDPRRGDVVLNPFDERSVRWDLFAEIRTPYDVDQLARSLIPDQDGSDRSWRGYARTFFTAVTRQAREAGVTDVGELYRLLVAADVKELRAMVYGTPAQPFLEEHNSRMFDSIRSVTSSAVGALEYVTQQKGEAFSIRRWVAEERPGVLFMPYKAGQIAGLSSAISGWMRLAIFETMDGPAEATADPAGKERRLWFVVDELDALGKIDGLKDALARLRKFGGRCVLGFQSIAQVSSTNGQGDAHTIVENCGNTLILRCSASEGGGTARFASQLIGDREVIRTTVTRSRRASEFLGSTSHGQHYSVEAAVLPSQIEQLPDLVGYLKRASEPEWRQVRLQVAPLREPDRSREPAGPPRAERSRRNDLDKSREGWTHE